MQPDQTMPANRWMPPAAGRSDPEALPAKCRHQAIVIDALSEALTAFERGASALKAENSALRADNDRLRRHPHPDADVDSGAVEVAIPVGAQAPGVARSVIAQSLASDVASSVLETAQLLVSELVSNSVRHSGVPEGGDIVLRVHRWHEGCRLEVEDPGRDGVIAPRVPDPLRGGGMGLHLVQTLSERWGIMRAAEGPTCVWAELPGRLLSHQPGTRDDTRPIGVATEM
jgi:anti-sigma regulatory factor (Ser/Thr protein kinase)